MLGEYDLTKEKLQDSTGVLPPKSTPSVIPKNWEPPKRRKHLLYRDVLKVSTADSAPRRV